jgi:hypothetical protein
MAQESAFTPSIWPSVKSVAVGIGMAAVGAGILWNGAGDGGALLMIIGIVLVGGGVLVTLASLMGKRGGYGPCPVCQVPLEATTGDAKNMLCAGCGAYVDVAGDRLVLTDPNRTQAEARFGYAAPTPWPEIRTATGETISFASSAQDYVKDKLQELMSTRQRGTRVLEAKWPDGCCVCGKPATRTEPFAKKVKYADATKLVKAFDETATLLAPAVPYCNEHRDGIDFDNVTFHSVGSGGAMSYGIKFRSLAYREAFRRLNPWPWVGLVPPKPKPTEAA